MSASTRPTSGGPGLAGQGGGRSGIRGPAAGRRRADRTARRVCPVEHGDVVSMLSALPKCQPWANPQPIDCSDPAWSCVSTPSATTSRPRSAAIAIVDATAVPSRESCGIREVRARSSLSTLSGRLSSRVRDECPAP